MAIINTSASIDRNKIEKICRELLVAIGEDPDREGLKDTPRRWAGFWSEFIDYNSGNNDVTFSQVEMDQMIVIKGMKVWSLCEHHLIPFWAEINIGYLPGNRVLGLSKFARIAQKHAHRLQIQERLCRDIADEIQHLAMTEDVAVICTGEHLCMTMRGIKMPGLMKTSVLRGAFRSDHKARNEFFQILRD